MNDILVGILTKVSGVNKFFMDIWDKEGFTEKTVEVYNSFDANIDLGMKVIAKYFPYTGKWYIITTEC